MYMYIYIYIYIYTYIRYAKFRPGRAFPESGLRVPGSCRARRSRPQCIMHWLPDFDAGRARCWAQKFSCGAGLVFRFFFIEALSVQSGHCRAMGYRMGDDIGPGRNERRPSAPIPIWPGYRQISWSGSYPSGQRRPPNFGGRYGIDHLPGGRRPPGPDYVGRWGWGMTCGGDKWRDWVPVWARHCVLGEICASLV